MHIHIARPRNNRSWLRVGIVSALLVFLVGGLVAHCAARRHAANVPPDAASLLEPVRPEPESFPVDTNLPPGREGRNSGSIDMSTFSPGRDLVFVDDERVWWESDNDTNDDECDHSVYHAMETPLRRVIELVCREGGTLEVHDAYRPSGIHNPRSLHREGRAVDLTCDQFPLEKLAKLTWMAGFDWVLHEKGKGGNGAHIHASVRRAPRGDPGQPTGSHAN